MFTKNLEELIYLSSRKDHIKRFLKKHFIETKDYVVKIDKDGRRGRPIEQILLTETVFNLIKNNYNLKNRYVLNAPTVNPRLLSIENATIGFLVECLRGIADAKRQYKIGLYAVDCYIPECNLIVECDEFGHKNYNPSKEKLRERYINSCIPEVRWLRFNPNDENFELTNLLNKVLKYVLSSKRVADIF